MSRRREELQWNLSLLMEPEHVSDGFIIHSLILDLIRRGPFIQRDSPLSFPHKDVHQKDRFKLVLQDRNNRFSSYCRPAYNHACDLCAKPMDRNGWKGNVFYISYVPLVFSV